MNKKLVIVILVITFLIIGLIYIQKSTKEVKEMQKGELKLTNPAFKDNSSMPDKYGCQGENINPLLNIEEIPEGTESLVLIIDDPDAPMGIWVHWVIWNIPIVSKIGEDSVPKGAVQGLNDFNKHEYGGPCPPSGTHRYVFQLYALDTVLDLDENSRKKDVEKAMQGHILSQTKLIGLYSKK